MNLLVEEIYRQEFVRNCETDKDLIACVVQYIFERKIARGPSVPMHF